MTYLNKLNSFLLTSILVGSFFSPPVYSMDEEALATSTGFPSLQRPLEENPTKKLRELTLAQEAENCRFQEVLSQYEQKREAAQKQIKTWEDQIERNGTEIFIAQGLENWSGHQKQRELEFKSSQMRKWIDDKKGEINLLNQSLENLSNGHKARKAEFARLILQTSNVITAQEGGPLPSR